MKRTKYFNTMPEVPDLWPIRKALTLSDVDITHPFLTLPRQQVETHIVMHMTPQQKAHLQAEGQAGLDAYDDDTGDAYAMKLKWRGSYYNLIGKWGKIVRGKGLDVGQEIRLRWFNSCLYFSVSQQRLAGPPPPPPPPPPLALPAPPVPIPPLRMIPAAPPPIIYDHWPIRKVLTSSDVDPTHPFLPLPRKSVEDHILVQWAPQERERLRKEEHVCINARDYDTGDTHEMKLRWHGNYYNLIGKWGNIVRHRGLVVGQEIRLRWMNGCLYLSAADVGCNDPGGDSWPVRKALTLSDVDINHPFLTLPGKAVEDHILFYWSHQAREQLRNDRQVGLNAQDGDTGELYVMKLKWRGSYYNLIGKWVIGSFVQASVKESRMPGSGNLVIFNKRNLNSGANKVESLCRNV
ncbi:Unknown protein [Striga hermonthica]|uniref:B3 domain-containing protein n=1 Tax=Striga hermonthica TaxID=68872 RepID=A0A9N7MRC1_STRHE|nr:Unknown protein [Striga hermonthica]